MKIYDFKKGQNGFNYVFEKSIPAKNTILLKSPSVASNKRGVNDIGFAYENGITLYATISSRPENADTIWQKINPYDEVNKTTSFIKIENTTDAEKRVNIRVIMC